MTNNPGTNQSPDIQADLERFGNYLRFLAEIKLGRRLRKCIDASDIVQETMMRAYVAWGSFRGNESAQRVAWLRQILMRTILHALRDAKCAKRDMARELRLDPIIDESSRRIEQWLADDEKSPSEAVAQAEELFKVAEAVYQLPEAELLCDRRCISCALDFDDALAAGRTAHFRRGLGGEPLHPQRSAEPFGRQSVRQLG